MYYLIDTTNISVHGTSFQSIDEAKNYAFMLQRLGLCETFKVGLVWDGETVYTSDD